MKNIVYIFQHNKTIAFFTVNQTQIDDKIRKTAEDLMVLAIDENRAEKGYYGLEIINTDGCICSDSEDLII